MRSQRLLKLNAVFAAGCMLLSGPAMAQGTTLTLRDLGLSEAQSRALLNVLDSPAASPGIAFGSPVGFGADWGELGIGVGGQTLPDDNAAGNLDGSLGMTFGLGNAEKWLGLETTVNIISLRNSFGDDGSFGFKLHTTLPGRSGFAVGVNNVGRWGDAQAGRSSVYAVGTKFFGDAVPVALNLGVGDNQFNDIDRVCNGATPPVCFDDVDEGANIFGGVAVFPIDQLSLIADWTGRGLNLGLSAAPFRRVPLVGTIGALNVTGAYQGQQFGDEVQFGAGIGYNFSF